MKLLVFGSVNIDHVYHLPHLVRPGETIASNQYEKNAGGKGFNQTIALAKAGQAVWFAGAIGQDGLFLKHILEEQGVRTEYLHSMKVPTGHAMIQVDVNGQNSIILYGGANQSLTPSMMDEVLSHFALGDYLLMQNEISHGRYLLEAAAQRGLKVILNPSPASPEMAAWPLEKVDHLILNEVEGFDLTEEKDPDAILDALLARCPQLHIVLTLGANGSIYADTTCRIRQKIIPTSVADTTAAGDTFTGYYLQAMLSGKSTAQALAIAAQAASIAVSRIGASISIPTSAEVKEAMTQQ